MKRILPIIIGCCAFFACKDEPKFENADSAFEAGRLFIEGTLKGEFKQAKFYMLPSAKNDAYLQEKQAFYQHQDRDFRVNYRQASIIIENEKTVDDQLHKLYFKNSFDKKQDSMSVVKQNNIWLADPTNK